MGRRQEARFSPPVDTSVPHTGCEELASEKGTTLCQGPSGPRAALVTLVGGGVGSVPQSPPPPWSQSQGPPHPGLSQTFVSSFTQPGTKATKIELAPHLHDPSPRSDEIYLHLHQPPTPGLQLQVGPYKQLRNSTLPLLPPPQSCRSLPLPILWRTPLALALG